MTGSLFTLHSESRISMTCKKKSRIDSDSFCLWTALWESESSTRTQTWSTREERQGKRQRICEPNFRSKWTIHQKSMIIFIVSLSCLRSQILCLFCNNTISLTSAIFDKMTILVDFFFLHKIWERNSVIMTNEHYLWCIFIQIFTLRFQY